MIKAVVPIVAGVALSLSAGAGSGFDVAAFGRLPVSAHGRVEQFDSVARKALQEIRGPETAPIDPILWLLEVLAKPDTADTRPIFPIKSPELLGKLQLQAANAGTNYYAFKDLGPKASEIQKQVANVKASDRTPWQEELTALRDKLILYERLKNSLQPNSRLQQDAKGKPITFDFAAELARYQADLGEALRIDAGRRRGNTERLAVATEVRVRTFSRLFNFVSRTGSLALVPPSNTMGSNKGWSNLGSVIVQSAQGHQPPAPVAFFAGMSSAFAQGNPDAFNSQVAQYGQWLAANGLVPEPRDAGSRSVETGK